MIKMKEEKKSFTAKKGKRKKARKNFLLSPAPCSLTRTLSQDVNIGERGGKGWMTRKWKESTGDQNGCCEERKKKGSL